MTISDLETQTTAASTNPATPNSAADSPVDTTPETARRVAGVGLHPGPLHGKPAKLLALDVGLARIGVAVCDPLQLAARPVATLHRSSRRADFATLAETITRQEAQAIICGLPLNMDGSEGPQAVSTRKWALRFAQAMRTLLQRSLPIIFWDERLSSYAAQSIMHAESAGKAQTGRNVTQQEDAVAAAVILQEYLDHLRKPAAPTFTADTTETDTTEADTAQPEEYLYDSIVLPAIPATS